MLSSSSPITDQARLTALYEVSRMLGTSLDLDEALCTVMDAAIHLTGAERGFLMLFDETSGQLTFRIARNAQQETIEESLFEVSRSVVREAAQSGQPVVTLNAQDDPRFARQKSVMQYALRSIMAVPLTVRGKITGVLYVDNKIKKMFFDQNDLELLNTFAGQAAVAIENARLYEAAQQHADELENRVADRTIELSASNQELEAFSYSVAHDLRTPLRAINGYSRILQEDYGEQFNGESRSYLDRIATVTKHMQQLIDDLLALSQLARADLNRRPVDLSILARSIADELNQREPNRSVLWIIADNMHVNGDPHLLRTVLENLIGNAWKFTAKQSQALIEIGKQDSTTEIIYFVRDNGAGFNPDYARRLFTAFQRLHSDNEFPGSGVGLASVRRIVQRHGGRVWAEGQIGQGATFYFTLR